MARLIKLEVTVVDEDGLVLAQQVENRYAKRRRSAKLTGRSRNKAAKNGSHHHQGNRHQRNREIHITNLEDPHVGDIILASLRRNRGRWYGDCVKLLASARALEILAVVSADRKMLFPVDRRLNGDFWIDRDAPKDAPAGALVRARTIGAPDFGHYSVQILEVLEEHVASLAQIAIYNLRLPHIFDEKTCAEAQRITTIDPKPGLDREDLRDIPFLVVDPADARDHDDAIYAKAHENGWQLAIAIADVSYYVRPGSAMDREARMRGNSVYFPEYAIPMLPPSLSENVCSLLPGEDRAAIVCHINLDRSGRLSAPTFTRSLIRCSASITYETMQKAMDGSPSPYGELISPIVDAWRVLDQARKKRGALQIVSQELEFSLNPDFSVSEIKPRAELDAHCVIEEFMIAANVAAAEKLHQNALGGLYRIHNQPGDERLARLGTWLETIGLATDFTSPLDPDQFNCIIKKVQDKTIAPVVMMQVLQTQSQAIYSDKLSAHFGLHLSHYTHFTSPIRRYGDLIVHRLLLCDRTHLDQEDLESLAAHLSSTERRAIAAERETQSRHSASWYEDRIGETLVARISSVTRFGLFLTIIESGCEGFIPMSQLGTGKFDFDPESLSLTPRRRGPSYRMGQEIPVTLVESNALTGSMRFVPTKSRPSKSPTYIVS